MLLSELGPSALAAYERKKQEKISKIKKIKRNEVISRFLCYACILPFLHAASCLGQSKPTPTISKVGSVGFLVSVASVLSLRRKEEKETSDLYSLFEKYTQTTR